MFKAIATSCQLTSTNEHVDMCNKMDDAGHYTTMFKLIICFIIWHPGLGSFPRHRLRLHIAMVFCSFELVVVLLFGRPDL